MKLLTPREEQIVRGIAAGKTAKQIAAELGIAVVTVRSYVRNISVKLPGTGRPWERIKRWFDEQQTRARRVSRGPGTPAQRARRRRDEEEGSS